MTELGLGDVEAKFQPRTLANAPMPDRVAQLPRDKHGWPIPWFVATLDDGTQDLRIADQRRHIDALRFRLCWVCGVPMGANVAFVVGPMCVVNRISSDPPSHRDCAAYSAQVCPFLATPQMRRREGGYPADFVPAAGVAILRNPGAVVVWTTKRYKAFRPEAGAPGYLCDMGNPTALDWYAQGRTATRDEVLASMESGLPRLLEACDLDDNPEQSRAVLERDYQVALTLVPV